MQVEPKIPARFFPPGQVDVEFGVQVTNEEGYPLFQEQFVELLHFLISDGELISPIFFPLSSSKFRFIVRTRPASDK